MLVEGLHALFPTLGHDFLDLVDFALEDEIGNQWRVEHDLHGSGSPTAFAAHQALTDDAAQIQR